MFFRVGFIGLLFAFTLTINANAQGKFTDVRTVFEISGHDYIEDEVEVRRNEKAFVHRFRYQGEAILQNEYVDERDKVFPKGLKLFKIEIKNYNLAYCGSIIIKNLGAKSIKVRCFIDVDEDGLFDEVHAGILRFVDPVSILEIRTRKETRSTQLSYSIVADEARKDVGKLWFGIRNKRQKPHGLGIYAGTDDYDQFMYKSFIGTKKGVLLEFKDTSVEVMSVKKRKTALKIAGAIKEGQMFEISSRTDTAFMVPITVSNIK